MTTLIANQIERLNKAKADIKASIIAKGGIVPDTALIGDYADIIRGFEDMFNVGNYNYRVAPVDMAGLKEINWNTDDVNYLKYNTLIPKGEDVGDTYKVSDENKRIKITSINDISTHKDDTNFKYCPKFDTSNATDMTRMFQNCKSLTTVPLFDTSKVTNMYYMFSNCRSLTSVPLFDTSKVTNMIGMFYNCTSPTSVPLFNTSRVTNMISMFNGCRSLTLVPLFDTSNVTDMSNMFQNCISLITIPKLNTSKVTKMICMFYYCESLTSVPLFDTSKVTNMSNMFQDCKSLTSVPLFDTSKVTMMSSMFYRCSSLTTLGGFTGLKVNLDLSSCSLLTKESILNVFNKAANVTSSPKTLTLGITNLNKLTDAEKVIATNKGWVLK